MSDLEAVLMIWRRSSEAHAGLWASHLLLVVATLGFTFSSLYTRLARGWQYALSFLFLNLAIVNAWSIWDNLAPYNAAIRELQAGLAAGAMLAPVVGNLHAIDASHLVAVHLVLDVAVLVAMLRRPLATN